MSYLRQTFGNNWPLKTFVFLAVYLILTIWPILAFSDKIEFNPASFTQEWIKTICSISIIYLVLDYQKFLFENGRKKIESVETLNKKLIPALDSLKNIDITKKSSLDNFKKEYIKLYQTIEEINIQSFKIAFHEKKLDNIILNYGLNLYYDTLRKTLTENDGEKSIQNAKQVIDQLYIDLKKEMELLK